MVRDFLHVLGILNLIVFIHYENGAAFDAHIFYMRTVIFTERHLFMIRQHLHAIYAERSAPTRLRKRKVGTNGVNRYAGKVCRFFVETLRLGVANRSVERG